ncbi:cyclic nucleotide-gated ion channel 1 isoform X1 [Cucumis sativus]|uniref:cyclic nucleotide-gated ion channel 1 isoform X1 n=2 Tax=Cucumis sativus TaxID=3659 RepID=UPI0002B41F87|nr:cyclic nucleotide-gated ion channel 1 isoform X1 [Cucumis sativus]
MELEASSSNKLRPEGFPSEKKILDPQGPFLQSWNKLFVLSCVISVSLDPLFFYVPVIDMRKMCLRLDGKVETVVCILRFFTDLFYVVHIVFQFRTGFISPSSRVFGRGVLEEDSLRIATRYLSSYFLIDISSVLPLPQVVILIMRSSRSMNTKDLLKYAVLCQFVPRFLRIYPLYKEVTRTSGILIETAWAGVAFNLFLYMLAGHVFGAVWYLCSIQRVGQCWQEACTKHLGCSFTSLYCDHNYINEGNQFLTDMCPVKKKNIEPFNFGIFIQALQPDIVESDFSKKFLYCFWWGLRNLSSSGQNLTTSPCIWENCFAISVCISGLVLFAFLLGNMQMYWRSSNAREEKMRVRRNDVEQWMSHRLLPENPRERVRRYEHYTWQETRGVDEHSLLHNLPRDIQRHYKRHLCLALLMRVPMFEKMDEQLLDAMCARLKPVLYTEESCIVREGDPVDEMLFIMRGKLLTMTTNGGRTIFFNSDFLMSGDFCGEELLTWALDPHSSTNLPLSTRTVRSLTEVEAFSFESNDLKFVASQYRKLHSKQLRQIFRFYSQQWRTWAACFIQATWRWRRHQRKKLKESLKEEESRLKNALASLEDQSLSLGTTVYAARFAANMLRSVRRNSTRRATIAILLQKPAEPDFLTLEDNNIYER